MKDTKFSDVMKKPNEDEIIEVWLEVMKIASRLEDKRGLSRDTVLEGLLKGTLDLARKRIDERLFRKMNDTRRFYLFAREETKRRFDQLPNYRHQREIEERYGQDMLYLRDAKNFGWIPDDE